MDSDFSRENMHAKNERDRNVNLNLNYPREKGSPLASSHSKFSKSSDKNLNRSLSYPSIAVGDDANNRQNLMRIQASQNNSSEDIAPEAAQDQEPESMLLRDQSGSPTLALDEAPKVRVINNIKDLRNPQFFTR